MSEFEITPESLPPSWVVTNLGAVVDYGKTEKAEPSEIPDNAWVLELEDIEKDSSRILARFTQSQRRSRSTKNRFNVGDVLYGKLRPYLNKVVIADKPGFCTTEIVPLKAGLALDNRYLFHWLKHPAFLKYVEATSHGMNMPRLGTDAGRSAPLVVAPRNEQTRIADQLDTLLARIHACNDRLEAIPALLKRFRQAVLDAALSGRITEGWRDAESMSLDDWKPSTISDVAAVGTGSTPLRSNGSYFSASGTPWVTSAATSRAYIDAADEFVTPAAISAHRLKIYAPGTLLVAMYGEGKTRGQVSELRIHAAINQACAAISVDRRKASVEFVKLALLAQYEQMRRLAEGGNQPNLNLSKVKGIPVQLPPEREQAEIVRRVGALFALADRIEARYAAAVAHIQRLTPLTLAKAFRGELVQQDPTDEPASVLLQRLAKAPTVAVKAPHGGRLRSRQATPSTPLPTVHPDWAALPAGAWAAGQQIDEHATAALLIAVLKAWGQPMPQDQARLTAMLCLQPRLFTTALPAHHAATWLRLVGAEAEPLPASVAALQPPVNAHWRRALTGLRARGDLVASGSGPQDTWTLGPGSDRVDTAGWPDGRVGWVVAYLQTHGVEAVLPLLPTAAVNFVHARAA